MDQLAETRLFRMDFELTLKLRFEEGKSLEVESAFPDKDDLRSFLMTFRRILEQQGDGPPLPGVQPLPRLSHG